MSEIIPIFAFEAVLTYAFPDGYKQTFYAYGMSKAEARKNMLKLISYYPDRALMTGPIMPTLYEIRLSETDLDLPRFGWFGGNKKIDLLSNEILESLGT